VFTTNIAKVKRFTMETIFIAKVVNMASITLRNIPDDIHRKIKRIQLDYEDQGVRKTLEEIYLELITVALNSEQNAN
jgi:hypothetical protein